MYSEATLKELLQSCIQYKNWIHIGLVMSMCVQLWIRPIETNEWINEWIYILGLQSKVFVMEDFGIQSWSPCRHISLINSCVIAAVDGSVSKANKWFAV